MYYPNRDFVCRFLIFLEEWITYPHDVEVIFEPSDEIYTMFLLLVASFHW